MHPRLRYDTTHTRLRGLWGWGKYISDVHAYIAHARFAEPATVASIRTNSAFFGVPRLPILTLSVFFGMTASTGPYEFDFGGVESSHLHSTPSNVARYFSNILTYYTSAVFE